MKNIAKSTAEYTRTYENMRGVSFTSDQSGSVGGRYEYLENMYIDHSSDGLAIESIPGFRKLFSFGAKVNGIFSQSIGGGKEFIIVHVGTDIYRFDSDERDGLEDLVPIGSVADAKSSSFTIGRDIYIIDGVNMYKITADGIFHTLGDEEMLPHVPTMFVNGEPVEDRNMLTDEFHESYYVDNPSYLIHGSKGVVYDIDFSTKTCLLARIDVDITGDLYIPESILYQGEYYKVTAVGSFALMDTSITGFIAAPGLEVINEYAFYGCKSLKRVYLPNTMIEIENGAFYGCSALEELAIRLGIQKIGSGILLGCPDDVEIIFEGWESDFRAIENAAGYLDTYKNITYDTWYQRCTLGIPVGSNAKDITSVLINGRSIKKRTPQSINYYGGESFAYLPEEQKLLVSVKDKFYYYSCTIDIYGTFSDEELTVEGRRRDYSSTLASKSVSAVNAIKGCTISRAYDGTIFLTGNPELGGMVFYCSESKDASLSPMYFGARNFFIDGAGDHEVVQMLATHDSLAVFKNGDDGGGSIFYHTPDDMGGFCGKHYPVSYVHSGIICTGSAMTLFDDPLFLSTNGVCSLERGASASYREVRCRSSGVNLKLLTENLKNVSIACWCGYLVLCANGRLYLADSRDTYSKNGSYEYEWYYLNGIGTYIGDSRVYRYSQTAPEGFSIHEKTDCKAEGTVMSVGAENGETIYYTEEEGKRYALYPTEEMAGGKLSPAVMVFGSGDLLFFATESGDLCVFNNDKRGIAPDFIKASEDFDAADYEQYMGREIHPYFYSFNNHAPKYALRTVRDNCDVPYLAKSTVRSSLVIRCKNLLHGSLVLEVGTDSGGYSEKLSAPASRLSFDMIDFSALSFATDRASSLPVDESERNWTEKQISLYSDEYSSPFGVYSINYRYKIKGKIKRS